MGNPLGSWSRPSFHALLGHHDDDDDDDDGDDGEDGDDDDDELVQTFVSRPAMPRPHFVRCVDHFLTFF